MKKTLKKIVLSAFVAVISLGLIFCLGFNAVCVESAMADAVNGGGFYVGSSATLTIEGKKNLSGFVASSNGGGIYSLGTLNINGGTISGNTATSLGGGVYSANNFTMTDGTISDNTAASGGGLAITSNLIYITGGTIAGNTATSNAGGLLVKGCGVDYKNGSIAGNNADCGGGVGIDGGTFQLNSGSISGNKVTTRGGGLYIFGGDSSSFSLTNGTISGNSAKFGGGIYLETGTFTMSGGTISDNTSSGAGAAIYVKNGKFTMDGGVIINNTSTSASSNYDIYGARGSSVYLNAGTVSGKIGGRGTFYVDIKKFNFDGTYKLREGATVVIKNYSGEKLNIENIDCTGAFLQFENCTSAPTLSNLSISGYDSDLYEVKLNQVDSTTYNVEMSAKQSYNEPEGQVNYNITESTGAGIFKSNWYQEVSSITGKNIQVWESIQFRYLRGNNLDSLSGRYEGRYTCLNNCEYVEYIGEMSSGIKVCTCNGRHNNLIFMYENQIYASEVMQQAFNGDMLPNLQSIIFENFDTSNTYVMQEMFVNSKVSRLDLSGFNTENTILFNGMFKGCTNLRSLDISNFVMKSKVKANGVPNIVGVAEFLALDSSKLKYLYTPKSVSKSFKIRIGDASRKFYDAVGLYEYGDTQSAFLPDLTNGSRTYVDTLPKILGDSRSTYIDYLWGRYIREIDDNLCIKYTFEVPEIYKSNVNNSSEEVVGYMRSVKSVNAQPELVIVSPKLLALASGSAGIFGDNIGNSSIDRTKIASFNFQNICTDYVEDMRGLFAGDRGLKTIYGFQNFHFSHTSQIAGMFKECTSLQRINFYEKQYSESLEASELFAYCINLEYVNMKYFNLNNAYYSDMFKNCTNLKFIETPFNNGQQIDLPVALVDADGNSYNAIPANLQASMILTNGSADYNPTYYDFANESTSLASSDSVKKIDKINFWSGYSAFALICISALAYPIYEDRKRRMKKR